jgi:hypothetical protein
MEVTQKTKWQVFANKVEEMQQHWPENTEARNEMLEAAFVAFRAAVKHEQTKE